ncbi:MAG: FIST C-terminal domain-containing protein [Thermoleophilia bacterium]|nr:FIST C-terminal domain-containing protein [Thermoleophilia bacterium]
MPDLPRFASAVSTLPSPAAAAGEAARAARDQLAGAPCDLCVVFATPDLMGEAGVLVDALHAALAPAHLIGCTAEAVIGAGREIEQAPGLSVWAAHLPGAAIETFHLVAERDDDGLHVMGWPLELDPAAPAVIGVDSPVVLLADPFTFPADELLHRVNEAGRLQVVGGMASGGRGPGGHRLLLGRDVHVEGAVGVGVRGAGARLVVSQGCRPIGPEMVITAGRGSVVTELAGRPALEKLKEVLVELPEEDRALAEQGLLAGLVIDENRPDYVRGDFLIRGILGGDPDNGAIVVGERVRVGQTMRLQVRDAATAGEDLGEALAGARAGLGPAGGGLVFSCNGRGTRMFSAPDHDAGAIESALGPVPTAGFFCNGEIGPVGGRNFLHGFTATMVFFPATTPPAD